MFHHRLRQVQAHLQKDGPQSLVLQRNAAGPEACRPSPALERMLRPRTTRSGRCSAIFAGRRAALVSFAVAAAPRAGAAARRLDAARDAQEAGRGAGASMSSGCPKLEREVLFRAAPGRAGGGGCLMSVETRRRGRPNACSPSAYCAP